LHCIRFASSRSRFALPSGNPASKWAAEMPCIRLVSNGENRGKGYSVRHGMLEARGDIALFTDADLSSPIEELQKLLVTIVEGNDVAIGSRALDRRLSNYINLVSARRPESFSTNLSNSSRTAVFATRNADSKRSDVRNAESFSNSKEWYDSASIPRSSFLRNAMAYGLPKCRCLGARSSDMSARFPR